MTPEKVLFRTNDYIERLIDIIPKSKKQEKSKRENLDFALSIKSAIEKQIPKKPLNPCGRYYGKAKGGNCPICGAGTNSVTYTYCRKCGQALDWSDIND